MPRHLSDADLPQLTITSSSQAPALGTLVGSENFDSGTTGASIVSPATFLYAAFPTGSITFETGGYSGKKAFAAASGTHYIKHDLGGSFPDWRDAGTVDVKFKVSALPTSSTVNLGAFENAPGEEYVFGINTAGNIGIGYVTPNAATKTTYAIAPEEWVRVAFTYINDYSITLRLFHGANINGTVPDETITRQGSFQNLRYYTFGKKDAFGNSVAVSWDDLSLYYGVPDWDTTLPQRTGLQFAGAGISSMVDNPNTSSTDITVANNPSSVEFEGVILWELSGQTFGTGGESLDLGSMIASDGSTSWFDAGASDLANGLVKFAEPGLYRAGLHVTFAGDVPFTYASKDLFSVMMRVYNPDDSLRYDLIRPVLQIKKEDGGADIWTGDVNLTDVMEVGSYILFYRTGSDQMRSRPNVIVRAMGRKCV